MANVIEVHWAPKEAEQLGKWLQNERESRSWTRGQLAQRMGYRNLSRGGSRIADWEKGRDIPRGDRVDVLQKALQLKGESLKGLFNSFYEASRRNKTAYQNDEMTSSFIERDELRLLTKHHNLLMREAHRILERPSWANIRIVGSRAHAAYLGGSTLTLGELLESWLNGRGVVEQPNGRHHILACAGSPLSGSYSALTFGPDGVLTTTRGSDKTRGSEFKANALAFMLHNINPQARPASQWSLGQVLASFGVEIPDIEVFSPAGEEIGRYNHTTRCFNSPNGNVDLTLLFEENVAGAQWIANWEETGRGSHRMLIGQLSPPRRGTWQGDRLAWTDSKGQIWHGNPGAFQEQHGGPAIRLNRVAPLPLLSWLAENN
jgi:transcriptional regulator with XRE-family HTH domain